MSFEEKSTWIYAAITVGVSAVYFAVVLRQVRNTDVTEIAYVGPMLTAIGVAVALNILAIIVAGIASPQEAGKKDERDKNITRYGQYVGYPVLGVGVVGALVLTMAEFEHFWIANAIYLAFVVSSITESAVKIVAYRRGL